jgi:hypothetical protein
MAKAGLEVDQVAQGRIRNILDPPCASALVIPGRKIAFSAGCFWANFGRNGEESLCDPEPFGSSEKTGDGFGVMKFETNLVGFLSFALQFVSISHWNRVQSKCANLTNSMSIGAYLLDILA